MQGATTIMIVLTDAAFVLVLVRVHRLIWRHDLHMRRNPSATQRIGKARYMIEVRRYCCKTYSSSKSNAQYQMLLDACVGVADLLFNTPSALEGGGGKMLEHV